MDNINNRYIPVRERIFTLLKSKGISQREFAEAIGVHAVTITDWKNGKNFSFVKRIPDIAQALDTTEVWLLTGNSPDLPAPAQRPGITMNREIFVQNIKKYCAIRGVKPTVACRESGVSRSFISDINRGQTPSVEKVQMLAQYLGVTTSELLGETLPALEQEQKAKSVFAEHLARTAREQIAEEAKSKEKPIPEDGDGPRADAHRLVDQIPPENMAEVVRYLKFIQATSDTE